MASKQLGKLRQWAGEVISSREKTVTTDEFRDLERDIELRKDGLQRMHMATEEYMHDLSKRRESAATDEADKILSVDALGIVMIAHGEEFGHESAFGTSLVKLGRAHCQIATLQEAFTLTVHDTFIAAMQRYGDEIKAYEAQRKKLDSRRLSYDAAINKVESMKKNKKTKEKDLEEAEDELETAKQRFEETSEDVRARMYAIQENEIHQLRDVTAFLDHALNFADSYANLLRDVKADWVDSSVLAKPERPTLNGPSHSFSSTKAASVSSRRSVLSRSASRRRFAAGDHSGSEDSDDAGEHGTTSQRPSRAPSLARRKSDVSTRSRKSDKSSKTLKDEDGGKESHSRTPSKSGRKRSESQGEKAAGHEKRRSVAGWIGSLGRSNKSKDNFASLRGRDEDEEGVEEEEEDDECAGAGLSNGSSSRKELRSATKTKEPARKRVRALHDFTGSVDELSFATGDEIAVVSEVLDGWWMGELDGKRGLFPTTYVEVVHSASTPSHPPLPRRPSAASKSAAIASQTRSRDVDLGAETETDADTDRETGAIGNGYGSRRHGQDTTDTEDEHAENTFGDHMLVTAAKSPVYGAFAPGLTGDADSMLDANMADDDEEEDMRGLVPHASAPGSSTASPVLTGLSTPPSSMRRGPPPKLPSRRGSEAGSTPSLKKPPPPPPPRRAGSQSLLSSSSLSSINIGSASPAPSFHRSNSGSAASSAPSVAALAVARAMSQAQAQALGQGNEEKQAESPFDEPASVWSGDVSAPGHCTDFKQNPFKPKGMCSNCFEMHG